MELFDGELAARKSILMTTGSDHNGKEMSTKCGDRRKNTKPQHSNLGGVAHQAAIADEQNVVAK